MSEHTKYLLGETEIPHTWYNIVADLPRRRRRCCTRAPANRSGPAISRRCSRWR